MVTSRLSHLSGAHWSAHARRCKLQATRSLTFTCKLDPTCSQSEELRADPTLIIAMTSSLSSTARPPRAYCTTRWRKRASHGR